MKTITVERVMSWEPCGWRGRDNGRNYTIERVECLFEGRESLTLQDVVALGISREDVIWTLLHLLTSQQLYTLTTEWFEYETPYPGTIPSALRAATDAAWHDTTSYGQADRNRDAQIDHIMEMIAE